MAKTTVEQEQPLGQDREKDRDWESECYQAGCTFAREEAQRRLEQLEEKLYQGRPEGWQVVGFRQRVLVTRFGELAVRRRLYVDEAGQHHFLLDEHLGLREKQVATPEVQEAAVALASICSFAQASRVMAQLTAGVLSSMTVARLLGRTAQAATQAEGEAVEACFGQGKLPEAAGKKVERLYLEGDGVWVRLQKEGQRHLELKAAIAYEGWQGEGERRRLLAKRAYCHALPAVAFWEGASLAFERHWDLAAVGQVVVGGDGAAWIEAGAELFAGAVRQLDGFHLARACGRALGKQEGARLYEHIRQGHFQEAEAKVHSAGSPERKAGRKALSWLSKVIARRQGKDWRLTVGLAEDEEGSLGTMEGNVAQLLAARLKDKGRSWSVAGARAMAKVQELESNGELGCCCYRQDRSGEGKAVSGKETVEKSSGARSRDDGQWLQASLPALRGPASSAPWVQSLRQMAHSPHLLN